MLRAAFTVRALSHARDFLKVNWADGSQTMFPSMWLRSAVRDPTYFNQSSLIYKPEHLEFITKRQPLVDAEETEDKRHIKVTWQDHSSEFNTSWLRAQDTQSLPSSVTREVCQSLWVGDFKPPVYDFSAKESQFEEWIADLKKYGLIFVENAPLNKDALVDFLNMIGPLKQRIHPTPVFTLKSGFAKGVKVDFESYGKAAIPVHTDHSYYPYQSKIQGMLTEKYEAPEEDTVNFFSDSFKILEDFKTSDPQTFALLQSSVVRQGRRRMDTEEDCELGTENMYQWDAMIDRPAISVEDNVLKTFQYKFSRHAGIPLDEKTAETMPKLYRGLKKIQDMSDDPRYQVQVVLRPGMIVVFDNMRVLHGRSAVHPRTSRVVHGAYIADEVWRSRCRIINGQKSGLEDRWLRGCTDEALQALARLAEAE